MRANRVVLIVLGAVAGAIGACLLVAGVALTLIHAVARDSDGYYSLDSERYTTSAYAITSEKLDFGADLGDGDWTPFDALGTARIQIGGTDEASFVGIARERDVDRYLARSAHDELADVSFTPFDPTYRRQPGEVQPPPPAEQDFWVASASGTGSQTVTWEVESGRWAIVVMNADASRGVSADVAAGIKTGVLLPVGIGLMVGATVLGIAATVLLVLGLGRGRESEEEPRPSPAPAGTYPARIDGSLDAVNRWMWLVKWFLAIPHLLVLCVLWIAFGFLTVLAGVAILFTGRYPRAIFDFNVGVLRWAWRVCFYAFTLGTDRYPPFSLHPDVTYPADLEVEYPRQLSRGLVLVKSWLLAVPHYLIVSFFGGAGWWAWGWRAGEDDRGIFASGLIGLMVLIAAVVLLFTRRYPRTIFDFVMGMVRWSYRVAVYAALMRDEYPPFRFDSGGADPGSGVDDPPSAGPGAGTKELVSVSTEFQ